MFKVPQKKRYKLKKYDIGGDVDTATNQIIGSLIPTTVQNWMRANANVPITSLQVARSPIKTYVNIALQLMSAGKFDEVKRKLNIDKLYHLFIIINNKWRIEKNDVVKVQEFKNTPDTDKIDIDLSNFPNLQIKDLFYNIPNVRNFWGNYDPVKNNCQDWVLTVLRNSTLITPEHIPFIKQDIESIIKDEPQLKQSFKNASLIARLAGSANKLLQWASLGNLQFEVGGQVLE